MALDERLYRIDRDPDGSDTIWFVFSARSVPAGKFSMSGIMRELPGDKVFFNCLDNSWFLDVEDDIDSKIDEVLAARPYARRLFIGTSMGGAGALMFGAKHDATRLLAFSLNTLIGERFTHSALYVKDTERDLLKDVSPAFAARCTAVLGMLDPADTETARRLIGARVDTRIVRSNHDTAGMLARKDAIVPLLKAFEAGEPLVIPEELLATQGERRLSHNSAQLLKRIDAEGQIGRDVVRGLQRLERGFGEEILRKLLTQHTSDHEYQQAFDYSVAAFEAGMEKAFIPSAMMNAAYRLGGVACETAAYYIPAFLAGDESERGRRMAMTVADKAYDADAEALIEAPDAVEHLAALAERAYAAGSSAAALDLIERIPAETRTARDHFLAAQAASRLVSRRKDALRHARAAVKADGTRPAFRQLLERLEAAEAATSGDGQAG